MFVSLSLLFLCDLAFDSISFETVVDFVYYLSLAKKKTCYAPNERPEIRVSKRINQMILDLTVLNFVVFYLFILILQCIVVCSYLSEFIFKA